MITGWSSSECFFRLVVDTHRISNQNQPSITPLVHGDAFPIFLYLNWLSPQSPFPPYSTPLSLSSLFVIRLRFSFIPLNRSPAGI